MTQAKGLEFDYVVALDVDAASYPDTPAAAPAARGGDAGGARLAALADEH
ncbi:MAG: hypothetical protein R3E53_08735 [Myxococcota bacterium]